MKMRSTLLIVSFFGMSVPAFANGAALLCDRGSLDQRIKCLSEAVEKLSVQIGELRQQLSDRPTKSEVADMIKAATDQIGQNGLKFGSVVSLRSVARPDLCVDKRSQDDTTIQAWRCNNDNNHQLQHWTVISPN
jgi:hypothetical protein